MLGMISEPVLLALIGGAGGVALGLAARLGRFCTMGAIEDMLYAADDTRMRMWVSAIGIATIMTFALSAAGMVTLDAAVYLVTPWSPVCAILGGLLFGYGMALAGNCAYGALARCGGGDLRNFVIVLVTGIAAMITLSGPLAAVRVAIVEATSVPAGGYAHALSYIVGLHPWIAGVALGIALLAAALLGRGFYAKPAAIAWSAVAGVAIASGWLGTSWVATHGFEPVPVISHTYAAPLGETILYLMTASGGGLGFGVGSVFGVLAGAFLGSLIKGHFRWEACEDPRELRRQMLGAAAMGVGAVFALGCTIGQGVSAFSVMAYSAPIVMLSIIAGAALGLRQLIVGLRPVDKEW